MSTMITEEVVFSSIMIVVMMLVILSVPSILLTVRNSAKLLKRYRVLRSIKDVGDEKDVPQQILNEWNAVNSPMGYTTLITEEIERLNGLKPALFQAELAVVLAIALAIVPGYEQNILIFMIALCIICILSIIYGTLNTKMYTQEYLKILKTINDNSEKGTAVDGMYG